MENLSLLYPEGYDEKKRASHRLKNYDFIKELQLESLVILIQDSHRGMTHLKLQDYFTTDEEVLKYRLDIVEDMVRNREWYDLFCKAIPAIRNVSDLRRSMSGDFSIESALGSIRFLELYIEIVDLFEQDGLSIEAHSGGLLALQDKIREVAESGEYRSLREELGKEETNFGLVKSVTLGINLDETLRVQEAGIVSVNMEKFHQGTVMDKLLKKTGRDSMAFITPLFSISKGLQFGDAKAVEVSTRSALNTIFARTIRSFGPAVQKYFSVNTSWFVQLLDDLRFLTAGVKFILDMKGQGFAMCKPVIAAAEEKQCHLSGVYNPVLAMKGVEKTVVSNSFAYDENGRFYLVTGPNHGGKSIFAYSIGMAQALFQLGLFVPAQAACISPVTGIFTHFPVSDEDNYGKGRLESECARLGKILEGLEDTDILLMDESFSSTSGMEAGYIASQVLTGIGVIGCGGIFVTHIHDLTQKLGEYNNYPGNKGKIDNLVALMENKEDGIRSYKVERTMPDGLSYAKDIAARYGLLRGLPILTDDDRIRQGKENDPENGSDGMEDGKI